VDLSTSEYRADTGWLSPLASNLDSPRTLVLAFGGWELKDDPTPFRELGTAFPRSLVMGCSTAGEIAGRSVQDGTVSVAVTRFRHTDLRFAHTTVEDSAQSADVGRQLAGTLAAENLTAVFVLSHGVGVNGTALVHSLARHLPEGVTITGGLAGDGARLASSWVLVGGRPEEGVVSAVGFYGDALDVGVGVDGGWNDFGPDRTVTRSEGHVLLELDGKPALDLYKEYLGEFAADLPGSALLFPLALRRPGSPPLVRTILGVDEDRKAMIFAGDMPEGSLVRLMRTTNERLVLAAGVAIGRASERLPVDRPALVVSVSCLGRRLLLGERTDEEVETVLEGVPRGSAHVGFYSNGEIAAGAVGAPSELHNQTITITTFSER